MTFTGYLPIFGSCCFCNETPCFLWLMCCPAWTLYNYVRLDSILIWLIILGHSFMRCINRFPVKLVRNFVSKIKRVRRKYGYPEGGYFLDSTTFTHANRGGNDLELGHNNLNYNVLPNDVVISRDNDQIVDRGDDLYKSENLEGKEEFEIANEFVEPARKGLTEWRKSMFKTRLTPEQLSSLTPSERATLVEQNIPGCQQMTDSTILKILLNSLGENFNFNVLGIDTVNDPSTDAGLVLNTASQQNDALLDHIARSGNPLHGLLHSMIVSARRDNSASRPTPPTTANPATTTGAGTSNPAAAGASPATNPRATNNPTGNPMLDSMESPQTTAQNGNVQTVGADGNSVGRAGISSTNPAGENTNATAGNTTGGNPGGRNSTPRRDTGRNTSTLVRIGIQGLYNNEIVNHWKWKTVDNMADFLTVGRGFIGADKRCRWLSRHETGIARVLSTTEDNATRVAMSGPAAVGVPVMATSGIATATSRQTNVATAGQASGANHSGIANPGFNTNSTPGSQSADQPPTITINRQPAVFAPKIPVKKLNAIWQKKVEAYADANGMTLEQAKEEDRIIVHHKKMFDIYVRLDGCAWCKSIHNCLDIWLRCFLCCCWQSPQQIQLEISEAEYRSDLKKPPRNLLEENTGTSGWIPGHGGDNIMGDAGYGGDDIMGDAGYSGDSMMGDAGYGRDKMMRDAGYSGDSMMGDAGYSGDSMMGDAVDEMNAVKKLQKKFDNYQSATQRLYGTAIRNSVTDGWSSEFLEKRLGITLSEKLGVALSKSVTSSVDWFLDKILHGPFVVSTMGVITRPEVLAILPTCAVSMMDQLYDIIVYPDMMGVGNSHPDIVVSSSPIRALKGHNTISIQTNPIQGSVIDSTTILIDDGIDVSNNSGDTDNASNIAMYNTFATSIASSVSYVSYDIFSTAYSAGASVLDGIANSVWPFVTGADPDSFYDVLDWLAMWFLLLYCTSHYYKMGLLLTQPVTAGARAFNELQKLNIYKHPIIMANKNQIVYRALSGVPGYCAGKSFARVRDTATTTATTVSAQGANDLATTLEGQSSSAEPPYAFGGLQSPYNNSPTSHNIRHDGDEDEKMENLIDAELGSYMTTVSGELELRLFGLKETDPKKHPLESTSNPFAQWCLFCCGAWACCFCIYPRWYEDLERVYLFYSVLLWRDGPSPFLLRQKRERVVPNSVGLPVLIRDEEAYSSSNEPGIIDRNTTVIREHLGEMAGSEGTWRLRQTLNLYTTMENPGHTYTLENGSTYTVGVDDGNGLHSGNGATPTSTGNAGGRVAGGSGTAVRIHPPRAVGTSAPGTAPRIADTRLVSGNPATQIQSLPSARTLPPALRIQVPPSRGRNFSPTRQQQRQAQEPISPSRVHNAFTSQGYSTGGEVSRGGGNTSEGNTSGFAGDGASASSFEPFGGQGMSLYNGPLDGGSSTNQASQQARPAPPDRFHGTVFEGATHSTQSPTAQSRGNAQLQGGMGSFIFDNFTPFEGAPTMLRSSSNM